MASDVTGVGTARKQNAAAGYGGDKGIFAYGYNGSNVTISNLVSNSGVIAADVSGVGSAKGSASASEFSFSA